MTQEPLSIFDQVLAGAKQIQETTRKAQADIAFSQSRIDTAEAMSVSLASTKTTINAWNPSATYKASDLNAVKGQLINIIDQLSTITTALNELYTYRKANDQSTIDINNALIWIVREGYGGEGEELVP